MCSSIETAPAPRQAGLTLSDSSAVFVGRVVDVWPSRSTLASESKNLSLGALRRLILRRWQGSLSREEEHEIRTNENRTAIEVRYGLLQRVRFAVTEVLVGPQIQEVYTDASSCGYAFQQGQVYLVNARRDGNRLRTGACSRTTSIMSYEAVEDLKALRAWRSGKPLLPRIYGRVGGDDLRSGIRVSIKHGQDEEVLRIGPDGRFVFDDLKKDVYQFQVEDERGSGERLVDLSRIGCFEAFPSYSDGWRIGGLPAVIERPQVPPLFDPPPLNPTPVAK